VLVFVDESAVKSRPNTPATEPLNFPAEVPVTATAVMSAWSQIHRKPWKNCIAHSLKVRFGIGNVPRLTFSKDLIPETEVEEYWMVAAKSRWLCTSRTKPR
jgi:hypothetical protein